MTIGGSYSFLTLLATKQASTPCSFKIINLSIFKTNCQIICCLVLLVVRINHRRKTSFGLLAMLFLERNCILFIRLSLEGCFTCLLNLGWALFVKIIVTRLSLLSFLKGRGGLFPSAS